MKISAINVYEVNLPFKLTFAHSQKEARSADNIVVEILTNEQGLRGYGEGAPRPYVTGETQEIAARGVRSLCLNEPFPWNLDDISRILKFVDAATGEGNHNSALCALEMALLDLFGRKENRNILDYLSGDYLTHEVRYGGTAPIAGEKTLTSICELMRRLDIKDVRLKVGRDFEQNCQILETARHVVGSECDLRVDVNCAWDLDMAKQHLPFLESYQVSVLEQPFMPEDPGWEELTSMMRTMDVKLMADESVFSMADLETALSQERFDIINVKPTKCGGLLNTLTMVERIRAAGLRYQMGCQLGESGILSAAGRALCAASSDALYYDGSLDAFLLRENLTTEHVTFNHGGKAAPLKGPGLGITVNEENLKRLSDHLTTIRRP